MKKIPVPIVPPIPIAERLQSPTVRLSSLFPVSAPVSSSISSTGLRRNTCSFNDATVPYLSLRVFATAGPGFELHRRCRAILSRDLLSRDVVDRPGRDEWAADRLVVGLARRGATRQTGRCHRELAISPSTMVRPMFVS